MRVPAIPPAALAALVALVAGVPPHAHCEMCGTPVEVGARRCGSAACEERFQQALKAKKRGMWMFVGLIALLLLFTQLTRLGAL